MASLDPDFDRAGDEGDAIDAVFDLLRRPAWHQEAACRGADPAVFFPERGASTREAKEVCAGCPVRADCLAAAVAQVEHFGIWGGTSDRVRRKMRRDGAT